MRIAVTISDLTAEQWDSIQRILKTEYTFRDSDSRICLVVERDGEERHAQMPLHEFSGLMMATALGEATAGLLKGLREFRPKERPVLPTPDQVRHLSAEEAAALAAQMNEGRDK